MRLTSHGGMFPQGTAWQGWQTDPFEDFFTTTMAGGTSLVAPGSIIGPQATGEFGDLVTVTTDVILEYERTILELRRELHHYKRLLSRFLPRPEVEEAYVEREAVRPMDAASVRVLNSILTAKIPRSATFLDFEEGEL